MYVLVQNGQSKEPYIDYISPRYDFDLEDSNPVFFFSQDTLAYDDAPVYCVPSCPVTNVLLSRRPRIRLVRYVCFLPKLFPSQVQHVEIKIP